MKIYYIGMGNSEHEDWLEDREAQALHHKALHHPPVHPHKKPPSDDAQPDAPASDDDDDDEGPEPEDKSADGVWEDV